MVRLYADGPTLLARQRSRPERVKRPLSPDKERAAIEGMMAKQRCAAASAAKFAQIGVRVITADTGRASVGDIADAVLRTIGMEAAR